MAEEAEGIRVGTTSRGGSKTKDRNAESFWIYLEEIKVVCLCKAQNPKWGKRKISEHVLSSHDLHVAERRVQQHLEKFFYDEKEEKLFVESTELSVCHRQCVTKDQLLTLIVSDHDRDHRHAETIYETLRISYYPIVRETVKNLFKQHVNCLSCRKQMPLPKTSLTRKTILATYPNSRWQMDLKKLPACRGYNYACNIVDCFSRFAMGGPIKSKSTTDVVEVFTSCAYQYGPPRILQTDNGREFNNSHLNAVIDELKAMKINGRPYHPQSQGRVERFNQTVSNFLRRDLQNEKDWPSRLQYFYYTYNTRSSKSLKNHTPYDMFFKRPNFSLQTSQSRNNLSREEIEFLDMDHVPLEGGFDDVDGDVKDEEQCEHASVPEDDICLDSRDIISPEADVTGNDGAEYEAAGDNSDGTDDVVDTDIPALPTSHGDLED